MKLIITAFVFIATVLAMLETAQAGVVRGMSSIYCANSPMKRGNKYAVSVFTNEFGTEGNAIVTKNGEVILVTAIVKATGNGDTFAEAHGMSFELTVDLEDSNSGKMEFELGSKSSKVRFGEMECSNIPKNWPNPYKK